MPNRCFRFYLFALCLVLLLFFCAGCGGEEDKDTSSDDDDGDDDSIEDSTGDDDNDVESSESARPLLDLTSGNLSVPFPSMYFASQDESTETGLLINIDKELPDAVFDALHDGPLSDVPEVLPTLDGFSILGPITIPFSDSLGLFSWTEDDPGAFLSAGFGFARIYDIDQNPPCPVALWYSFIEGQNVLVLRPNRPLTPGHRILVCLVSPLSDFNGNLVKRPELFDRIMNKDSDLPQDSLVEDMIEMGDLIESGKIDINPDNLLLAFSYTTGTGRNVLETLRQAVDELDAQTPFVPEELHYETEQTLEGTFLSPDFRIDGMIPAVKSGDSVNVQEMVSIPFVIRIPETISSPLAPVIYLHGLSCSRYYAPVMDELAFFAVDALDHEDRVEEYGAGPWPFIDLINLRIFRDNIRQTVADNMALAKMVAHLAEDPVAYGLPEDFLSKETLGVLGHSLGCINGSIFSAVDPAIDHFACVGGGGFLSMYRDLRFYDVSSPAGMHGLASYESMIFEHLLQAMMDGADGVATAPLLISSPPEDRDPRNLLVIEAVGDQTMPNVVTEAFAWGAGLSVADNELSNWFELPKESLPAEGNIAGGNATGLLYEFDFDSPLVNMHGTLFYSPLQIKLVHEFLKSSADTGVGIIIDPVIQ